MLTCSGLKGEGLDDLWREVLAHQKSLDLAAKRRRQQVRWTWTLVRDRLLVRATGRAGGAAIAEEVERDVLAGTLTPALAADRLLAAFERPRR